MLNDREKKRKRNSLRTQSKIVKRMRMYMREKLNSGLSENLCGKKFSKASCA